MVGDKSNKQPENDSFEKVRTAMLKRRKRKKYSNDRMTMNLMKLMTTMSITTTMDMATGTQQWQKQCQ
jgi:hypothetical protein